MIESPAVFVIILNFNLLDDLKDTVKSFMDQDYPNLHIVVSDNGSKDGSIDWLESNHPSITILKNKTNLGWAEGNNVGIRYALLQNADYILLSNNDLYFEDEGIISSLIDTLRSYPKAIIGPKQYYFDHPERTFTEGRVFLENKKRSFNKFRVLAGKNEFSEDNFNIVDYVPGSFMLIPTEVFKKVGLIDNDYYLYGEDTDFSLRAWKEGYVSMVDKNLYIYHKVSATTTSKELSKIKVYYQARNVWFLLKKRNGEFSDNLFFGGILYMKMIKWIVKNLLRGNLKHSFFFFLGSFHGFFGLVKGQYESLHKG